MFSFGIIHPITVRRDIPSPLTSPENILNTTGNRGRTGSGNSSSLNSSVGASVQGNSVTLPKDPSDSDLPFMNRLAKHLPTEPINISSPNLRLNSAIPARPLLWKQGSTATAQAPLHHHVQNNSNGTKDLAGGFQLVQVRIKIRRRRQRKRKRKSGKIGKE